MNILATISHAVLGAALVFLAGKGMAQESPEKVAEKIREEATRPNLSEEGRPLPLASHWTTGNTRVAEGWAPRHQLDLIEKGHLILPWFALPLYSWADADKPVPPESSDDFFTYYEAAIKRACELQLPIVLVGTQWESWLSDEPYLSLPSDQNPNVVSEDGSVSDKVAAAQDGSVSKKLDPFGPTELWTEVGKRWTDNARMKKLQEWYPNPPLVIFLSNNEHGKLLWTEAEESKRYLDKYGKGRDAEFKKKVIAEGWIERYRALQQGMREGLSSEDWKKNARFVGYDAFGQPAMGRWGEWEECALSSAGRIDANPLMWDGGSPSYYTHNWNASTDFTVWSPQIESMNWVFMLKEAHKLNPNFWFELGVWDGYTGGTSEPVKADDKRDYYASLGQTFTPERYAGFVQYGMWLLRPRVVREFRLHIHPWEDGKPYFRALLGTVDRIHKDPVLREWWRKGELVPNRSRKHPYQSNIPAEFSGEDRWFLLDADCNPKSKVLDFSWKLPVFSLALTRGQAPMREWLVYAHAPLGNRKDVTLTIPDYEKIQVDVSVEGSFYQVSEEKKSVNPVRD